MIVATSTHAQHTPAAAPLVADRLGSRAAAFDVSAGCAGFCHALSVGSDLVRGGNARYVLVIGVEKLSHFLDPTDRGTAFIFADGAGAVVVGAADEAGIGPVAWGSDGSQSHVITQEPGCRDADAEHPMVVRMEGTAVFRWAPFAMADVAREAVDGAGLTLADLDAFIPHQANLRITETLARNLKLPDGIAIARDVQDAGNTSAASVPLAIEAMLRKGEAKVGRHRPADRVRRRPELRLAGGHAPARRRALIEAAASGTWRNAAAAHEVDWLAFPTGGVVRCLKTVLESPGDGLGAGLDADLPVGVPDVRLHRVDGQVGPAGDLVVREPAGDVGEHLGLALGEPVGLTRPAQVGFLLTLNLGRVLAAVDLHDPGD